MDQDKPFPIDLIVPFDKPIKGHPADYPERFVSLYVTHLYKIYSWDVTFINRALVYVNELENEEEFGVDKITPFQQPEIIAIKTSPTALTHIERELDILLNLSHPNIMKLKYFYSVTLDGCEYINLLMEYLPHSLCGIYFRNRKENNWFDEATLKSYARQLLCGLEYMHSQNICHRDLKPKNILVNGEATILKICDFGSAKVLVPNQPNALSRSSGIYHSIEMLVGDAYYTTATDIWSCACILAKNIHGHSLFIGSDHKELIKSIVKILGPPDDMMKPKILQSLGYKHYHTFSPNKLKWVLDCPFEPYVNLIQLMLTYSHESRPTATQLLNLSYFN